MAYQVIARKWRPQGFDEVTGQELITRTLRGAIEHDRLHHAYLFSGARGVGKTTTARLLAKALNCHKSDQPTPTPCKTTDPDQCASCREVAEGRSIDVLEIDAASNTGVDNVREAIINTVGVRPARDRYKVFIIDEVHMLSGAAFNALLKTLEEPPPRVVFIMATTESHKLPDTILSRCQQFEFRTIPAAKIAERLRIIADAEGIKVSEDALREVARAGEGSMRDAQSAFDQVISFSVDAIETEDVETALGLASTELRARVIRAIADETPAAALAVVDDLAMRGHDLRNFCRDLLAHLRDLLVVKVAGESAGLTYASDAERQEMAREAAAFSESDLVRFFHSLTETERALREGAHPRYQLEIGLVKLIEMRRLAPVNLILERLAALEQSLRTGHAPASGNAPPASSTPAASDGSNAPPRRSGSSSRSGSASPPASFSDAPVADAGRAFDANEPDAFDRDDSRAPGTDGRVAIASNQNSDDVIQAAATPVINSATPHQKTGAPVNRDDDSMDRDAADAPPFEPLPVRTPVAPASRVKPIPSLPASTKTKTTADAAAPPAPDSSRSIPSLPGGGYASSTTKPSSSPSPSLPASSIPSSPSPSLSSSSPSPSPSSLPPPASGLKLVPPSSATQAEAALSSSSSSFFDASFEREEIIEWNTPTATPTAPGKTDAPPPTFAARTAPASNNVAAPSSSNNSAQAASTLELIKKSLDNRRKPFLVIALEGAHTVRIEGDELYVMYAPEAKHLRDTLAKPDNVKILREVCREVAGRDMGVAIVVRQAGDGEGDAPRTREDEATLEKQRLREMAEQHPAVQQLLKTFGAEIIEVRRIEPEAQ